MEGRWLAFTGPFVFPCIIDTESFIGDNLSFEVDGLSCIKDGLSFFFPEK